MGIRRLPALDHAEILTRIDAKLASYDWQERLSAIDLILEVYNDVPKERTVDQLVHRVERLATDKKWEIRKASLDPLLELRRPGVRNTLERLRTDPSRWVRQKAKVAKKKFARITDGNKGAGFAYEATKGLGGSSAEKIFKTALKVGEKHYQEFAADIAHELNTYSAIVQGHLCELEHHLGGDGLHGETAEIFSKIQRQSGDLQRLVDDMCFYTRDAQLEFEWIAVRPIIEEAIDIACKKTHKSLPGQPVDIQVQVPDDLGAEVCRERFCRALTNFASNGLEAMVDKDGDLRLQVAAELDEFGHLLLSIVDTGCGMDAAQLEDAKKRFSSGRRGRGGIGLGLPLAIKIIEAEHGGQVEMTSEPGLGTTIEIHLSPTREERNDLQGPHH